MRIRIATRKSPLAVWQAEHVGSLLRAQHAGAEIELVELMTKGDKILDQALSKVGGKDLFVKEIEEALLDGRADVAVHSLKDMPTVLPEGLVIGAFPEREDPRDALVSLQGYTIATLPHGAKVATSSLRRQAQLLRRRPDLSISPIRGNVQTRLRKLAEHGFDATVLALAGLVRLGLANVVSEVLEPEVSLPAIGQGILAVETRAGERALVAGLDDPRSRTAATAERGFLHRLRGGCQVPIAAFARVGEAALSLRGLVASLDGAVVFEDVIEGPNAEAETLGARLADRLLERGAGRVLDALAGR
jgi:hydroxymethylbilane synthase